MLNKEKCDPELGLVVQKYLIEKGVSTPMVDTDCLSDKIACIEEHFSSIMQCLGLDLTDDSLADTPVRVAKMYVNEIFWGLNPANFPKCTAVDNKMNYNEMVIERNINVQSFCEHHFVSIDGQATLAYIPKDKVIGLSKLNRIVEFFSRRPQIQERLTEQVFHTLTYILETDDIAVTIEAKHNCVISRGVEDVNSTTITNKFGGKFQNDITRAEFLRFVTLID
ncbi:MAG: GTP cyclohydrolase I FolE [Lentisphaeria bacterium]|nr:GTP cyclohydrolase I FolE [Lentisphaeria bacterium]NQZ66945.1 GTP cyclohydrolase I FolE [Lentisphaeria bacterium]